MKRQFSENFEPAVTPAFCGGALKYAHFPKKVYFDAQSRQKIEHNLIQNNNFININAIF